MSRKYWIALACAASATTCRTPTERALTPPPPPTHPIGDVILSLPVADSPFAATVSPSGVVVVTRFMSDSLAVIDVGTPAVTGGSLVGKWPRDVLYTADGSIAYVANQGDNTISVLDGRTLKQQRTFPTACAPGVRCTPLRLALGPGGATLYVATDNGVTLAFDPAAGVLKTTVGAGWTETAIVAAPDGSRLYVASAQSGTITEIATASNTALDTLAEHGSPQDMTVSPDGSQLYVANLGGWLSIWDLASRGKIDSIPMPFAYGVAVTPDGAEVWVARQGVGQPGKLSIVDLATRTVRDSVVGWGEPSRIAFAAAGAAALVTDLSGWVRVVR